MSRPTLLVVDDEPYVTEVLSMLLELSLPVDVVTTNSSLEAREILQQRKITLLLTDYLMPDLNGIELIHGLREQGIAIPVILLTGYMESIEQFANTQELLPMEIIMKPWKTEHLLQRIKAWLSSPSVS